MKLLALAFALIGIVAGMMGFTRTEPWTIVVTGDLHGYLSPCGCSSPMIGGIRRRATAINRLGPSVIVLDNGGFVKELSKQSEFKAEAAAQAITHSNVSAINLSAADAQLGLGNLLTISQISEGKLISTNLPADNALGIPNWIEVGPFLVGGITTQRAMVEQSLTFPMTENEVAIELLLKEAGRRKLKAILMISGPGTVDSPMLSDLSLIVVSSNGEPASVMQGNLVSPGDRGRNLVLLDYNEGFSNYRFEKLGPEIEDDPDVAAIYTQYLQRVESANLLEQWPRIETEGFAGNEKCISCHAEAGAVWKESQHAHALETLEKEGHGRDPDCVSCHVVGLSSNQGFRSRNQTPNLTDVGCESCHGPGEKHSIAPLLEKMVKVGEKSCAPCHTIENSPNFNFETYWSKIRH